MTHDDAIIHQIVDTIPDTLCVIDHEGVILLVNRAWREFCSANGGSAAGDCGPGANYLTVCACATGPLTDGSLETLAGLKAVISGEQDRFVRRYACPTPADERWFELHASPMPGSGPRRLLIIHRNITQTVKAERALRASEERYRQIMETSGEGIWGMDGQHRTTIVNARMARMLGYGPEEIIGMPVEAFMFPEDLPAHSKRMQARHGGAGDTYEHRFRRKNGSTLSTRVSATALTDQNGQFIGSFAMFSDITDQRRVELSLVEIQEQIRTFFAHASIGMGILDHQGQPLSLNPVLTELATVPLVAAHAPGNGGDTLLSDATLKLPITGVAETREPLTDLQLSAIAREESDSRHFTISLFPLVTPGSATVNVGIILMETTASVRDGERIRQSLREKEILLKEVHHRVKNNMQVISSLLNMQGKTLRDPAATQAFDECRQRVRSMSLVHERLYNSADLGQIDFGDYSRFLISQLALTYSSSNIRVVTHCDRILFGITTAIPAGLILNELVSNVFKYAFPDGRPGRLSLVIRAEGPECVLQVEDDGIGIPASVSINEPTTLGLQLVKALSPQLDGTLEFTIGKGTLARLRFPLEGPA